MFRGQTGSQSSIVPAMDALFQVGHSDDPLKSFLDELHAYRPVEHRRFIEDLAAQSTLRSFVANSGNAALKEAFNACLEQAARFRTRHLEYAASYINKQAGSIARSVSWGVTEEAGCDHGLGQEEDEGGCGGGGQEV